MHHPFDLLQWLGLSPPGKELHAIAFAMAIAIGTDSLMGEIAATTYRQLRSKYMREMLVGKLTGFMGLMASGAVIGLLIGSWYGVDAAMIWIIRIELVSMCETLKRLQDAGVNFGKQLGPVINYIGGFLEIEREHHVVKVSGIIEPAGKDGQQGATVFSVATEETTHTKDIGRKGGGSRPKILKMSERPVSITTGPSLD